MSCLFCQIAAKSIPSEIVYEDDRVLAFKDIHPKADIHVLVIPKQHIDSLSAATAEHEPLLGYLNRVIGDIARQLGVADRFRVAVNNGRAAGQEIDHLHYHLMADNTKG
jgi:histidine triad (HIT) family protein